MIFAKVLVGATCLELEKVFLSVLVTEASNTRKCDLAINFLPAIKRVISAMTAYRRVTMLRKHKTQKERFRRRGSAQSAQGSASRDVFFADKAIKC